MNKIVQENWIRTRKDEVRGIPGRNVSLDMTEEELKKSEETRDMLIESMRERGRQALKSNK